MDLEEKCAAEKRAEEKAILEKLAAQKRAEKKALPAEGAKSRRQATKSEKAQDRVPEKAHAALAARKGKECRSPKGVNPPTPEEECDEEEEEESSSAEASGTQKEDGSKSDSPAVEADSSKPAGKDAVTKPAERAKPSRNLPIQSTASLRTLFSTDEIFFHRTMSCV